jgi:hypothetical protein
LAEATAGWRRAGVDLVDEHPGAAIRHADRLGCRGDRLRLGDGFQQVDLAGADGDGVAGGDAEAKAGDRARAAASAARGEAWLSSDRR